MVERHLVGLVRHDGGGVEVLQSLAGGRQVVPGAVDSGASGAVVDGVDVLAGDRASLQHGVGDGQHQPPVRLEDVTGAVVELAQLGLHPPVEVVLGGVGRSPSPTRSCRPCRPG